MARCSAVLVSLAVWAAAVVPAAPVHAQISPGTLESRGAIESAPNSSAKNLSELAEVLFRKGRASLVQGDYAHACELLAESDRIEPSPGAKLNLAFCEEQRGFTRRAWYLYEEVVAQLSAGDERRGIAEQHTKELASKLAFVRLQLPVAGVQPARVRCDGVELSAAVSQAPLALEPGRHVFEVIAPGRSVWSTTRTYEAGRREALELRLGFPQQPRTRQSRPDTLRTVGWAMLGSSASLLVIGAVSGAMAFDAKQTMARECNVAGCSEAGLRAASRGDASATISNVIFAAALTTAAISAIFLLTNTGRPRAATAASAPVSPFAF